MKKNSQKRDFLQHKKLRAISAASSRCHAISSTGVAAEARSDFSLGIEMQAMIGARAETEIPVSHALKAGSS